MFIGSATAITTALISLHPQNNSHVLRKTIKNSGSITFKTK